MKKAKVIDLVNATTGEIIGYFKKTEKKELWDWAMYNVDCKPIHIDYIETWRLLDYTRAHRASELWNNLYLLYRLI